MGYFIKYLSFTILIFITGGLGFLFNNYYQYVPDPDADLYEFVQVSVYILVALFGSLITIIYSNINSPNPLDTESERLQNKLKLTEKEVN